MRWLLLAREGDDERMVDVTLETLSGERKVLVRPKSVNERGDLFSGGLVCELR